MLTKPNFTQLISAPKLLSQLLWIISLLLSVIIRCYWEWAANCEPIFGLQLLLAPLLPTHYLVSWSVSSILLYDLLQQQLGIWTIFTSGAYLLVSYFTSRFTAHTTLGLRHYLSFTVLVTMLYDLLTASMGPLCWQQSWAVMLMGQLPFTLRHLLSNLISAGLVYIFYGLLTPAKITRWSNWLLAKLTVGHINSKNFR